jgi:hypothetical protein
MVSGVYCIINEPIFTLTALDVVYNSASALELIHYGPCTYAGSLASGDAPSTVTGGARISTGLRSSSRTRASTVSRMGAPWPISLGSPKAHRDQGPAVYLWGQIDYLIDSATRSHWMIGKRSRPRIIDARRLSPTPSSSLKRYQLRGNNHV